MAVERRCCKCPKCVAIRKEQPEYNYLMEEERRFLSPMVISKDCVDVFKDHKAYIIITNNHIKNDKWYGGVYVPILYSDWYIDEYEFEYVGRNKVKLWDGSIKNVAKPKMISIIFPELKYRYVFSRSYICIRRLKRVVRRLNGIGVEKIYHSNLDHLGDDIKLDEDVWEHWGWHDNYTQSKLGVDINNENFITEGWF